MRKVFYLLICCISIISAIVSCTEGSLDGEKESVNSDGSQGVGQESVHGPITMQLTSVTATTAVFAGSLDIETAMLYTELGIIYSTDPALSQNNGTKVRITELINNKHFMEDISGLPHSSQIYYAPYYCTAAGLFVVGEVCKFTTVYPQFVASVDDSSVTSRSVNITCAIQKMTSTDLMSMSLGIVYSGDKAALYGGEKIEIKEISADGNVQVPLSNLIAGSTYYFCTYFEQDGNYAYGDVNEFTLPDPYMTAEKDLDMSAAVDLSSAGTANCYIVSQSGLYKFKTVKGNSNTSVDNVASCAILWETFGTYEAPERCDLITSVCYKDDYMAFQTSSPFKEGNAVVAAKDATGKILWSWHIWLTDKPSEQVYYNNAGTMMDRNLGAESPKDIGLFYQWGRKDPFVGRSSGIYSSYPRANTTIPPVVVESDSNCGTLEYAIANPSTFILGVDSDWLHSSGAPLWQSKKTIYDPCPAGWRMPDGGENGVWAKAAGCTTDFELEIDEECVLTGVLGDGYIFYPYTGGCATYCYYEYHNETKAYISGVNAFGCYWSCTLHSNWGYPYSMELEAYGMPYPNADYREHMFRTARLIYYMRSDALAVRCQKE